MSTSGANHGCSPGVDTVVEWAVPGADAELAAMSLWDRGATAVELRALGGRATLVASFPSDGAARVVAAEVGGTAVEVERGWADAWRDHAEPISAGDLVVAPAWRDVAVPGLPGRTVLRIDPGPCFGSGSHPSTRLLLGLLAATPPVGRAVADVGTGSGILAVAAAVLGASAVTGVDIDPASAGIVAANAELNGVADRVRTSSGSGLEGTFDLVLVNVTAAVHLELAPAVRRAVAPGGRVLLAGLLPGQWRHVAPAYDGFALAGTPELDGWLGADLGRMGPDA